MANGHGGYREGAGRKAKADEVKLTEQLSPLDDIAFKLIREGLADKDKFILKLFMEYRFGRPKQTIDATVDAVVEQITGMTIK